MDLFAANVTDAPSNEAEQISLPPRAVDFHLTSATLVKFEPKRAYGKIFAYAFMPIHACPFVPSLCPHACPF
jgi:hypothetical protein